MKDFKDTLLMPKTPFEMRGNLGVKEPVIQKRWADLDLYNKIIEKNKNCPEFNLHDGPPYANGEIHVGHAFNKTLKDFVVRYKNQSGFKARYIPGWDTHGLPIENALTKSGVNRKEKTPTEFRILCEEYARKQVARQREGFERLGVMGEYENAYLTLNKEFEADQIRVFAKMVEKGLIYKGLKPVYWSPSSESALAEAEIEYIDKEDPSIFLKFQVNNGTKNLKDVKLAVWTTTPWTLPANLAVCANPTVEYSLVEVKKEKFIVATELLAKNTEDFKWEKVKVLEILKGSDLLGLTYVHPLFDKVCPVINGDYVTTTDGTGLVHIAPGHGEDDFLVGKEYNLEILCPVNERGVMTKEANQYEGLFYEKCNTQVIEDLEKQNKLLLVKMVNHSYPHDWRTKKPIIYRATPQWFASIEPIRQQLLDEIKQINWVPKWGEVRISNMIASRGDWCISRQRAWGVPIPVFYCENDEEVLDVKVLEHIASLVEKEGSNVWVSSEAKDLLPKGYKNPNSPNGKFRKETDIMDVWFDSGTSYMLLSRLGLNKQADLYLEGSDQYRGWFNSSLITSVATTGKSPYKTNVTHGFVLDGEGKKMSKSVGNVVDPNKVFKELGADILRLWVSSVEYNVDVRISKDMLNQVSETYRKFRNTFRFLMANTSDFNPKDAVSFDKLNEVDKFMSVNTQQLVNDCIEAYDNYEFSEVYRKVTNFITNNLSAFYLDFTKDILYIEEQKGHARASVQTVLYDTLLTLLKLLSPIIPHTTSEAYDFLEFKEHKDIYFEDMPKVKDLSKYDTLVSNWNQFLEVRNEILKALEVARTEKIIGKSFNAHLILNLNDEQFKLFNNLNSNLRQILIVSKLTINNTKEFSVKVEAATGETCARCWQVVDKLNSDNACPRCEEIVKNIK
ncbi:MAG: isoleucine--tRNA ligase [bacterium]